VKPKLKIFINHPECSIECGAGMYHALSKDFKIDFFSKDDIKSKLFRNLDIIAFPGGIGDSDKFDKILKPKQEYIIEYIKNNGRYLGICMGAYWAGRHYFNILKDVEPVQYIKRPRANIKRSYGTTAKINWQGREERMYFYDGCSLLGNEKKFKVIARYSNNDPMAIIQKNIGLIGCHPESMPGWYDKKYMSDKWHNYNHHYLLLEFTKRLL